MTKLSAIAVSCLGGLCLLFGNAYAAPAAQTETLAQIHAKAGFQWPKDESRVNNNEGEENFVGDSEIIALGGASNETKDRPLG